MNLFKKAGVALSLSVPMAMGASVEVGAEQYNQPPASIVTTPPSTATYQNEVDYLTYLPDNSADNLESVGSDSNGRRDIIIVSIGCVLLSGAIFFYVRRADKRMQSGLDFIETTLSNTNNTNTNQSLLNDNVSPIGPEDDPSFWPPKS